MENGQELKQEQINCVLENQEKLAIHGSPLLLYTFATLIHGLYRWITENCRWNKACCLWQQEKIALFPLWMDYFR